MSSASTSKVHLLVLIHGMWGNPTHLSEMFRIYSETLGPVADQVPEGPDGERIHVIVPETNKDSGTYDGIDWGGERVAEEVSFPSTALCLMWAHVRVFLWDCGLDFG